MSVSQERECEAGCEFECAAIEQFCYGFECNNNANHAIALQCIDDGVLLLYVLDVIIDVNVNVALDVILDVILDVFLLDFPTFLISTFLCRSRWSESIRWCICEWTSITRCGSVKNS